MPLTAVIDVFEASTAPLITPTPTPVSAPTVTPAIAPAVADTQWEEVSRLAMSLFDLRAAVEAQLRTLTMAQRSLERVRRVDSLVAENDLLLEEMDRELSTLEASSSAASTTLATARLYLKELRGL